MREVVFLAASPSHTNPDSLPRRHLEPPRRVIRNTDTNGGALSPLEEVPIERAGGLFDRRDPLDEQGDESRRFVPALDAPFDMGPVLDYGYHRRFPFRGPGGGAG